MTRLPYSPAQAKQDRRIETLRQHAAMVAEYHDLRERTNTVKRDWYWCANLDTIEADLQQMEHTLAAFEWRHGIFDFR